MSRKERVTFTTDFDPHDVLHNRFKMDNEYSSPFKPSYILSFVDNMIRPHMAGNSSKAFAFESFTDKF